MKIYVLFDDDYPQFLLDDKAHRDILTEYLDAFIRYVNAKLNFKVEYHLEIPQNSNLEAADFKFAWSTLDDLAESAHRGGWDLFVLFSQRTIQGSPESERSIYWNETKWVFNHYNPPVIAQTPLFKELVRPSHELLHGVVDKMIWLRIPPINIGSNQPFKNTAELDFPPYKPTPNEFMTTMFEDKYPVQFI